MSAQSPWHPLREELHIWRSEGLTLQLWWRDDDAVSDTPQLRKLTSMAKGFDMQIHLAVIPKFANHTLTDVVKDTDTLIPLVHGWSHQNNAPAPNKKTEFFVRSEASIQYAGQALKTLQKAFGETLVPCFVPPWNRIDPALVPDLKRLGYHLLSTYGPRDVNALMTRINTHIDPINWRGTRSAVSVETLVNDLVTTLQNRRTGSTDITEPLGLLTHHLVHDPAIWEITNALLSELHEGPIDLYAMA